MLTQIINGRILTPQGWMKDGSVLISDNKILEVTNCDLAIVGANLIDAKGMYIVPGGVEIHVHGGGGRDFMEGTEDAFRGAVAAHMQHGTTSIFPTLSSSTIPMIRAAAATTEKLMAEKDSPILGLHLEGHYFNMKMAGGQIPENIKNPDPKNISRCWKRRIVSSVGTLRLNCPEPCSSASISLRKACWLLSAIHRLSMKISRRLMKRVIHMPPIFTMLCPVSINAASISMKELSKVSI